MESNVKFRVAAFVLVCAVVLALCAVATGQENQPQNQNKDKEVLTTLEQRLQKKISVDFRNTPIEDVIRIMAEQADVDIVKSPQVVGNVTATLTEVPLEEALNNILATHGYGYVATNNMIRIAPADEITIKAEQLVNRIYRITYADVKGVENALKKFISARGSLSSNPGTSNIIVTDTESKIKAIDTFIEEIDRMTPQILVEAKIYDITTKDRLDLGVEWEAGRNTTFTGGIGVNPSGETAPFVVSGFTGATQNAEDTTGALRFGWLNDHVDIDAIIRAQQEYVNATLLANPRILVLDNETATIKIVSEIPFQELTETSAGGSIGTTEFREVGVALKVTPHITRDNMIRVQLQPEFSIDTGAVSTGGGGIPQPVIDRRNADTTLLIKHGQTVVLGGLRKKSITTQVNKIPFFGDLPVIGILFKFNGEETINNELVVFITPLIVEIPGLSQVEAKQFEITEFDGPESASPMIESWEKE
jgi:type IV pilus assembly protein PilQ